MQLKLDFNLQVTCSFTFTNYYFYLSNYFVMIYVAEQRQISQITFGELRRKVAKIASALKVCGVTSGDRVVGNSLYVYTCDYLSVISLMII